MFLHVNSIFIAAHQQATAEPKIASPHRNVSNHTLRHCGWYYYITRFLKFPLIIPAKYNMIETKEKQLQSTLVDPNTAMEQRKPRFLGGMKMNRTDKENYYLDIAETVLERGTCLRRNFGAIIVKHDEIVSSGYTGAPRGRKNCIDTGMCVRESLGIPRGERYELCRSVHAEANAIISASRRDMIGSTLYLVGRDMKTGNYVEHASPCSMCKRLIINAGITRVIVRDTKTQYFTVNVEDWITNDESLSGQFGY